MSKKKKGFTNYVILKQPFDFTAYHADHPEVYALFRERAVAQLNGGAEYIRARFIAAPSVLGSDWPSVRYAFASQTNRGWCVSMTSPRYSGRHFRQIPPSAVFTKLVCWLWHGKEVITS